MRGAGAASKPSCANARAPRVPAIRPACRSEICVPLMTTRERPPAHGADIVEPARLIDGAHLAAAPSTVAVMTLYRDGSRAIERRISFEALCGCAHDRQAPRWSAMI